MPLTIFDPIVAPAPKIANQTGPSQPKSPPYRASRSRREPTGVAQLLPKLLALLVHLARLSRFGHGHGTGPTAALRNLQRHVPVTAVRCWRLLRIDDAHVAPRKDALEPRPLIASFGPVGVHPLGHGDVVVGQEGQVAGVGGLVDVEGGGGREGQGLHGAGAVGWWWWMHDRLLRVWRGGRGRGVVAVLLLVQSRVGELVDRGLRGRENGDAISDGGSIDGWELREYR